MPQAGASPPSDDSSLRAIVVRVAGAATTGIGVLGFVALVGGADYWLRFSSSGLPADETVADLSRNQLLVIGLGSCSRSSLSPWSRWSSCICSSKP